MKRVVTVLVLCALVLLMLTPVTIGVNLTSVDGHPAWADGSAPPPPFPNCCGITCHPCSVDN